MAIPSRSLSSFGEPIERRQFGCHPDLISVLGLGGYHLGKTTTAAAAIRIAHEAIDAGINFFDNAAEYHDGESERRMGRALSGRRGSVFLMTTVFSPSRDADGAMRQLEQSLRRLQTDYLDLWHFHECMFDGESPRQRAQDAIVEALDQAKAQGKVRYVGFTSHKPSEIHVRMLSFGYPFDACQLPLSAFDAPFRSFQACVLPDLIRRKIAVIGNKSSTGLGFEGQAAEDGLRYAMSLPVCTIVSGIDCLRTLRQNVRVAQRFEPMLAAERQNYEESLVAQMARRPLLALQRDGRA